MSFLLKNMISQKMKNLSGGGGEEEKKETGDGTSTPAKTGMTREEIEEYQRQLVEENFNSYGNWYITFLQNYESEVTVSHAICSILSTLKENQLNVIERDTSFAQKKAERATLRVHMRGKYRLPQSEKDESQIQMVGGDVDLPEDLAKMVEADEEEEEANDSFLGSIQNMDFDTLKNKAQDTFVELKQSAEEKCSVM